MVDVEPRDNGSEDGVLKQLLMNHHYRSSLSDQYKKHARVQDTTTTDTSSSSNKIHALITITDTGCGISPSFLSTNIFQPFSQENSLQIVTGLGLSIVKLLVE
ncbi:unnamed protein product [Rhizophagus irregularis]|nr:unnamed protein product [Rhizophagus irregularis]